MQTEHKIHYKRNILVSIILSEVLTISAFLLSPDSSLRDKKNIYDEPIVLINDVPQTIQSNTARGARPTIPQVFIPDKVDAFDLLEDVNLSAETYELNDRASTESAAHTNIRPVRSSPRQIFEVLPANEDNVFNGKLQLSLKINGNGRVVDHRILFNSLDCKDCLNDIIKAAYRSRWEPAMVNGKNSDYWVVKSYIFN